MSGAQRGLPEALERAAQALRRDADAIRPANGDPSRLAESLDPPARVRVLAWLLANEPAAGEELAASWAQDAEGAGAALLALDERSLPKSARKILRRIVHGLRTRGVAPPPDAPTARVATLPSLSDAIDEARITALDPRGARVVALATSHPGGGVRLFQIVIDDARGVLDFEVLSAARRDIRRWLRESARGEGQTSVAVSPATARALVARAAAHHPASRALPRGFAEWRSRVAEVEPDARTPGEQARAALAPEPEAIAAGRRVAELVREGAIGPWPPEPRALQELALRVAQSREGVLVVSEAARGDQQDRALDEAAKELAGGENGELLALRLEEVAFLFWKGDREDDARACLAAAKALRESDDSRVLPARAFVETWLAPILREPPAREAARPLVVRP
ncbi:MAG TPA: hypothetical protein VMW19_10925 [Myxococcota bacterium]|nr:hypothetical protein [Myxococcota bacterium]